MFVGFDTRTYYSKINIIYFNLKYKMYNFEKKNKIIGHGTERHTHPFEEKKNECNFCSLKIELNGTVTTSRVNSNRNETAINTYISKQHNTSAPTALRNKKNTKVNVINLRCKGFR